jgi:ATP-dependent DNA ligase
LYAFDLIELNGGNLCGEAWRERRRLLEDIDLSGAEDVVRLVTYGLDGETMHQQTAELRFEGTVAKWCRSRYHPGARSKWWQKCKHRRSATFAVMGWRPPTSRHPGGLVVAEAGRPVGVAMLFLSRQDEGRLLELVRRHGRSHGGMLTVPEGSLEAEIGFTERTNTGKLREAVCRRLRVPTTD